MHYLNYFAAKFLPRKYSIKIFYLFIEEEQQMIFKKEMIIKFLAICKYCEVT